jgi:hypothetical protein
LNNNTSFTVESAVGAILIRNCDGAKVGNCDGAKVANCDGAKVGNSVGVIVRNSDGTTVGARVGGTRKHVT